MATLDTTHCPICRQRAKQLAKNNYMLCNKHGWFDLGLIYLEIEKAAPVKVTAKSLSH